MTELPWFIHDFYLAEALARMIRLLPASLRSEETMATSDRSAYPRVPLKGSPQDLESPFLMEGMTHFRMLEQCNHLKEALVR